MPHPPIAATAFDAIIDGLHEGKNNTEIAERAGISESTVRRYKYLIKTGVIEGVKRLIAEDEAPPSNTTAVAMTMWAESTRTRIARLIAEQGPFPTTDTLFQAWKTVLKPGEITNVGQVVAAVRGLAKQGKVTFHTQRLASPGHSPKDEALTKITATPALLDALGMGRNGKQWPPFVPPPRATNVHKVGKDYTDPERHGSIAEGGPVEHRLQVDRPIPAPGIVTPAPDDSVHPVGVDLTDHWNQPDETVEVPVVEEPMPPPDYPILMTLRDKAVAHREAEARAEVYITAAATIEEVDTLEALHLQQRAEEIVRDYALTNTEAEYLRYANDHEA